MKKSEYGQQDWASLSTLASNGQPSEALCFPAPWFCMLFPVTTQLPVVCYAIWNQPAVSQISKFQGY